MDLEELAREAVDCGFAVHRDLGPGLLEAVYEAVMTKALEERGLYVERQKPIPFAYKGVTFGEAFRADLVVEGRLLLELTSVETVAPVHGKQLLTYLRLMNLPLGLLMNFGAAMYKDGVRRVLNARVDLSDLHWKAAGGRPL
jgi:iron complex transport system substrate-binding protein